MKDCLKCRHISPAGWCYRIGNRINSPLITCAYYEPQERYARPENQQEEKNV